MSKRSLPRLSLMVCLGVMGWMAHGPARADNIVPPGWVGDDPPYETAQEWDFSSPGPIAPDGDTVPLMNPGVPMAIPGAGVAYDPDGPFGLDGYVGLPGIPGGGTILFMVPNIPDDRPVKHLRIQINGVWDTAPAPPAVAGLTGSEMGDIVPGVFVTSDETFPGFHRWEDWDIFPNPDGEELVLHVPPDAFVSQVVIHTISIPEPASAAVWGLVGAAGVLTRRRRITGAGVAACG